MIHFHQKGKQKKELAKDGAEEEDGDDPEGWHEEGEEAPAEVDEEQDDAMVNRQQPVSTPSTSGAALKSLQYMHSITPELTSDLQTGARVAEKMVSLSKANIVFKDLVNQLKESLREKESKLEIMNVKVAVMDEKNTKMDSFGEVMDAVHQNIND